MPSSRRAAVPALLGDEILDGIGGYVAGNLLISVIAGVVDLVFLPSLGVPYALALALLVAVTDLIPLVGATIGAVLVTAGRASPVGGRRHRLRDLLPGLPAGRELPDLAARDEALGGRGPARSPSSPRCSAARCSGIVGALLAIPVAAAIALILREVVIPRRTA